MARTRRLSGTGYIDSVLVETPASEDRRADVVATTTMIRAAFERDVGDAPGRWMGTHRRWG